MKKTIKLLALLLACIMTVSVFAACNGTDGDGKGTDNSAEGGTQDGEEGGSTAASTSGTENKDEAKPASKGLLFSPDGDEDCYVSVGTCTDTEIVIPATSPDGKRVKTINYKAFADCTNLTDVYIPSSVTSLSSSAFARCTSLTSVTLPSSVKTMYSYAFKDCTALTTFTFSSSMKTVQNNVFEGCTALKTVNLPESIGKIKSSAFNGCTSLTDINFAGTKAQWEAAEKESGWDAGTGNYTVHCSDGDIAKAK